MGPPFYPYPPPTPLLSYLLFHCRALFKRGWGRGCWDGTAWLLSANTVPTPAPQAKFPGGILEGRRGRGREQHWVDRHRASTARDARKLVRFRDDEKTGWRADDQGRKAHTDPCRK